MRISSKTKVFGFGSLLALLAIAVFSVGSPSSASQDSLQFEVGEKLTYSISFKSFKNAGYAETFVSSEGRIGDKKAVEIRGRLKSSNFVSSAFYLFDQTRTVFAEFGSGLPLYVRNVSQESGLPKEKITNYLQKPATQFDLLTMLYKVRENGGAGSFSVSENGKSYSFDFAAVGGEKVETEFETFETTLSNVTSSYFDSFGVSNVRINFSADAKKIPVRFRLTTERGDFEALLASRVIVDRTPEPKESPSRTPVSTPRRTPSPTPTPAIYKENQPLPIEFPFVLKERLDYQLFQQENIVNKIRIEAEKRVQIRGKDTLVLKASVLETGSQSLFGSTDNALAEVDPETLVPRTFRSNTNGPLRGWSQSAVFDQIAGRVSFGNAKSEAIPVGTHSILSLAYAIRSFNVSLSRNKKNPVNDTRVSLFLRDKPVVLTLRPSEPNKIKLGETEVMAEKITIITGDRTLDRFRPTLWLGVGPRRLPLVFKMGAYRAELIR